MKHHVTIILVTRVDELAKVFEARGHELASKKNLVTLLMTENNTMDGNKHEIVKKIEDLLKDNGVASETGDTSFENDRPMEILVFYLVHDLPRPTNGSSGLPTGMFDFIADAGKFQHQDRETAHARRIIASVKNQLQSLFRNSPTPIELEDSVEFLGSDNPTRTVQNHLVDDLVPCRDNSQDNRKRRTIQDPEQSLKSQKFREKQSYRVILPDGDSKSRTDRKVAKAGLQNGCKETETDNLIVQSERLRSALQNADQFNNEMVNATEANLKKLVLTEAQEWEMAAKNRADQIANAAEARSLKEQKEEFERYKELHASSVKEERRLMDRQRQVLRQDRADLLEQKGELDRWELAKAGNYRGKERSLEDRRRVLEHEKHQFDAVKEDFDRTNDLNACRLKATEASLEKQRLDLEYVQLEVLAERERLRQQEIENDRRLRQREILMEQDYASKLSELKDMERRVQRDYAAKVSELREMESVVADRRRALGWYQQELLEQKEELEHSYNMKAGQLKAIERSVEQQRMGIDRDRSELFEREEELARKAETKNTKDTTEKSVVKYEGKVKMDCIDIPIIPEIIYWRIKIPPWLQ